jgi:hypothetical protein
VRFRFDDEALEVLIGKSEDKTENAFVGGAHTLCVGQSSVIAAHTGQSMTVTLFTMFKIHSFSHNVAGENRWKYDTFTNWCASVAAICWHALVENIVLQVVGDWQGVLVAKVPRARLLQGAGSGMQCPCHNEVLVWMKRLLHGFSVTGNADKARGAGKPPLSPNNGVRLSEYSCVCKCQAQLGPYEDLQAVGVRAQIHFFPIIFNGKQLYDVMVERCGESQNSGRP